MDRTFLYVVTYSLLQGVELGQRVVKDLVLQRHRDFSEKVVAAEHVGMPHTQPQSPALQAFQSYVELEHNTSHLLFCSTSFFLYKIYGRLLLIQFLNYY